MNANDLSQKHARELQELKAKQTAEVAALQRQIEQVEQAMAAQSMSLVRRQKEIELAQLRQNMSQLTQQHAAELQKQATKQTAELQEQAAERKRLMTRQSVEPMIKELLEEIATIKHFQKKRRVKATHSVPYEYERTEGWLFKKKIVKETRYRTEEEYEDVPIEATQDSPNSWSIEGKIPSGCTVIYTVRLFDTYFKVSAVSDASWEEKRTVYDESRYKQHSSLVISETITRDKMRGVDRSTKDLTRGELESVLLSVMSEVKEVCPGPYRIIEEVCVCAPPCYNPGPCGSFMAHPYGVCDMPSLWDSSQQPPPTPRESIEIGKPSAYLHTVLAGDAVMLYHSLLGNLRYAELDIVHFLELTRQDFSLEDLLPRFPEVDLEEEVKTLHRLGFLVLQDEEQRLKQQIVQREGSYSCGEMVRWLRLNTAAGCNLACTYCHGVSDMETGGVRLMPLATALRAIRLYTDLLVEHQQRLMQLRYFGGEPLLNWPVVRDSLNEAARLAEQYHLSPSILINTNATLLTAAMVSELSVHRAYIEAIVSLDGVGLANDAARMNSSGRGSFEAIGRGLDLLQEANIPIGISATLGMHNKDHLRAMIDWLLARNIYSMGIDPVRIVSDASDPLVLADALIDALDYARQRHFHISGLWEGIFQRLEHGATGAFCGGSGTELSVLPTGEIYPCQSQPVRLGTLDDVETRALFKTDAYRQVAMRVVGDLPECRGCEIEGMCVGGCAADAYAAGHNLYGRTRLCEFFRKMVRYHLELLGKSARLDAVH